MRVLKVSCGARKMDETEIYFYFNPDQRAQGDPLETMAKMVGYVFDRAQPAGE